MSDDDFNIDFADKLNDSNLDFDLTFDIDFLSQYGNRYINPKPHKEIPEKKLYFDHALKLAKEITIEKNQRAHFILSGNFIFGDFIEAFFVEKNIKTKKLIISTLSMSQNNVDSLVNLFVGGYIDSLDLIISDYFFAHERSQLIPYMLEELDINDSFQLAVAGSHTKICVFEAFNGLKYCLHGSSNLRSSSCLEQLTVEENSELYDFYKEYHDKIITEYSIINKSIRGDKLWQAVAVHQDQGASGADQRQQGKEEVKTIIQGRKLHSDQLESKYF